jgi:alpha-soluble NSF attachment protein
MYERVVTLLDDRASEAYLKAAQCEEDEALSATLLIEAANTMKKVNTQEAVKLMEQAIEVYCATGGIRMGAKYKRTIAEWFEEEFDYEQAITYYMKAADLQETENADSFGYQCILKAADLMVISKEAAYGDAIQKYEKVATEYLKNNLLRASAKDHVMKALLLYLAIDDKIGAQRCIDKYKDEDPTLEGSRELGLIEGVMKGLEDKDLEGLEGLIYNYNKITPFDKLKTKLLVKIKEQLSKQEGELSGGLS